MQVDRMKDSNKILILFILFITGLLLVLLSTSLA